MKWVSGRARSTGINLTARIKDGGTYRMSNDHEISLSPLSGGTVRRSESGSPSGDVLWRPLLVEELQPAEAPQSEVALQLADRPGRRGHQQRTQQCHQGETSDC